MQIENLTPEQVEMLDFMWNELDTEEEYLEWYDALDKDQQRMAESLQRLMIMESIDEEMLQKNDTDLALARSVLDRFTL